MASGTKKNTAVFLVTAAVIVLLTFLGRFLTGIESWALRRVLKVLDYLLMGASASAALRLTGMQADFQWRSARQYGIGLLLALGLSLVIAWIPAVCGLSLVGSHEDFALRDFVFNLLFYLLLVGPVEELVFRVYVQDFFSGLFRRKWIAVLIASALFGAWHLIGGFFMQAVFACFIGCVFGFAKQYLRELHFPGIALCHGFYDFLGYLARLTVC